jgi:site-specific DNA-cytosine methylase
MSLVNNYYLCTCKNHSCLPENVKNNLKNKLSNNLSKKDNIEQLKQELESTQYYSFLFQEVKEKPEHEIKTCQPKCEVKSKQESCQTKCEIKPEHKLNHQIKSKPKKEVSCETYSTYSIEFPLNSGIEIDSDSCLVKSEIKPCSSEDENITLNCSLDKSEINFEVSEFLSNISKEEAKTKSKQKKEEYIKKKQEEEQKKHHEEEQKKHHEEEQKKHQEEEKHKHQEEEKHKHHEEEQKKHHEEEQKKHHEEEQKHKHHKEEQKKHHEEEKHKQHEHHEEIKVENPKKEEEKSHIHYISEMDSLVLHACQKLLEQITRDENCKNLDKNEKYLNILRPYMNYIHMESNGILTFINSKNNYDEHHKKSLHRKVHHLIYDLINTCLCLLL